MAIKDLHKIEFWISTCFYILIVILVITNAGSRDHNHNYYYFRGANLTYSHITNYLIPELFRFSVLYANFLAINFCIIPSFIKKHNILANSFFLAGLFLIGGLVISICNTYTKAYILVEYNELQDGYNRLFYEGFLYSLWSIVIIAAYGLVKEFILYIRENKYRDADERTQVKLDVGFGLAFWFVGLLLWITTRAGIEISICWSLVIFSTIGIFIYSIYKLLPQNFEQGKKFKVYFWQVFFISILLAVPLGLISTIFIMRAEMFFIVFIFHLSTQLIVTVPLSWFVYKQRTSTQSEVASLRTKLGKSNANLSFLQSQINPHFLFNALNTLYGTALQENADRTGEGIQKLGDMMRFMLHENMQDKISLTREVEYLNNYIDLQKLRTSRSADIRIETHIDEQLNNLEITPMLLIPFVENAFKHGISLQQPSHIKITLQTKERTLFFDVNNSIYHKADTDPEKLKSGIGLENVKQRLTLLYHGKHELIIRESAKEFFVHLTLQLD
ncbi:MULTISPECIES: sensor histidine kinase [unclassified Pedobacter]|uniref:sensor histidine kinase n=1 Tax=unclassified Pedobacter TaxID=2628915 RepID=UPI001E361228|nr:MULTISPECIES: histidine kinase [unclassified Pedobacter]